jgi:hypothetical protein
LTNLSTIISSSRRVSGSSQKNVWDSYDLGLTKIGILLRLLRSNGAPLHLARQTVNFLLDRREIFHVYNANQKETGWWEMAMMERLKKILGLTRENIPLWGASIGHGYVHWFPSTFYLLLPLIKKELGLNYTEGASAE